MFNSTYLPYGIGINISGTWMGINKTDSVASTGIHYINLITSFDNVLILQKRYNFVIILPINPASNSDKVFS